MSTTFALQPHLTSKSTLTRSHQSTGSNEPHGLSKRKKPLLIKPEYLDSVPLTHFSANNHDYQNHAYDSVPGPPSRVLVEDSQRKTSSLLANYGSLSSSLVEMSVSDPNQSQHTTKNIRNESLKVPLLPGEAGRLVSTETHGSISIIIIKVDDGPFRVGRHIGADLTINKPTISSWHCKLYAIECDTGERLVCIEDTSTNGIRYNGQLVHKKAVILNDSDTIELSGEKFTYFHSSPPGQWQGVHYTPGENDQKRFQSIKIGPYKITERVLGSGFFSVVHLAIDTSHANKQIACKIVRRRKLAKKSLTELAEFRKVLAREVELNASLNHPNINRILDLKEDPEKIYLFLELVTGGDLFGYVVRHRRIGVPESQFIMYQLLQAVIYMHDVKQISHIDIKPENILLTSAGPEPRVLLADFGAARLADKAFCSMQGTMSYAAPEVLTVYTRTEGYDGKKADVWSLGICLYMMLCGSHPFDTGASSSGREAVGDQLRIHLNSDEVGFVKTVLGQDCRRKAFAYLAHKEVKPLLRKIFEPDPRKRYSAAEVLKDHWMSDSLDLLKKKYQVKVLDNIKG
ncbi:hypothetical protein CROQUDRAFT_660980 [Cronartium quercuum f. sp. fusiforme G11]|uniref:Pkinase-domain-containing protein n=1 Tax=Cronartium quercuum f. sp. fusiforme G11 TaxID=708437 RepID=A0A9P6TAI5_9BASI|nr:hypothetical protein CROQUDRAFT_660980 [Cronartium quercuum f. sp. fusiforme G11]